MSEARCAVHSDAVAATPCARCGDFACAACLAESGARKVCARCLARGGAALWPAGRAMSFRAIFAHALGRLPAHGVHVLAFMLAFLPTQLAGMIILKNQAVGGAATPMAPFGAMSGTKFAVLMICSLGGMGLMLLGWPFVASSASASYADDLGGRPRRSLWVGGRDLFLRALLLGMIGFGVAMLLACLPMMGLMAYVLAYGPNAIQPRPGAPPPLGFSLASIAISSFIMLPVLAAWHLAVASVASEDTQIGGAIQAALRFFRTKKATVAGILAVQLVLTMIGAFPGQVVQHLVYTNPWIAEPYGVISAFVGAAMIVFWALVYTAFYMGRADAAPAI